MVKLKVCKPTQVRTFAYCEGREFGSERLICPVLPGYEPGVHLIHFYRNYFGIASNPSNTSYALQNNLHPSKKWSILSPTVRSGISKSPKYECYASLIFYLRLCWAINTLGDVMRKHDGCHTWWINLLNRLYFKITTNSTTFII